MAICFYSLVQLDHLRMIQFIQNRDLPLQILPAVRLAKPVLLVYLHRHNLLGGNVLRQAHNGVGSLPEDALDRVVGDFVRRGFLVLVPEDLVGGSPLELSSGLHSRPLLCLFHLAVLLIL